MEGETLRMSLERDAIDSTDDGVIMSSKIKRALRTN